MLAAIAMVKDEGDIVAETVGRMAMVCDAVIVADNGSSDGTRDVLDSLGVTVVDDPDPAYYQSSKMSALAEQARELGADWIIPFDADEVWRAFAGLRETLESLPDEALIAEAVLFDHVATGKDPDGHTPIERLVWRRRDPAPLRKVAVRARPGLAIQQGNHGASFEGVRHPLTVTGALEVRHFPYRSVAQFISKVRNGAAAYAASDLPAAAGAHWRAYGRILDERGEQGLADVFAKWFYRDDPESDVVIEGEAQPALVYDPCALR